MILHNLTRKAAGVFLGTYLAVGGVDVAEGQDNKLGGKDGKAWVREVNRNGQIVPLIEPADVKKAYIIPTDKSDLTKGGTAVDFAKVDLIGGGRMLFEGKEVFMVHVND